MKPKERMRAALRGTPMDRPPISTWGHDFLREWSAEDLATHTVERQRKYGYDFVKLNPRWTLFAEPWGNRYQPPSEQKFPRLTHRVVSSTQDLRKLPKVAATHPNWLEHIQALQQVIASLNDEVDVLATLFSPLAVLGLLCGGVGKPLTGFAAEDPQAVHAALGHITQTLREHARDLTRNGAAGLFYAPLQWTSTEVCSEGFYAEFGRPYDLSVLLAAADAELNMLHVCGNFVAMPRFYDYPTPIINWDNFGEGNPSLREVAEESDRVVAGGVPHRSLHRLEDGALLEEMRAALQGAGDKVMLAGGCGVGALVSDTQRRRVVPLAEQLFS